VAELKETVLNLLENKFGSVLGHLIAFPLQRSQNFFRMRRIPGFQTDLHFGLT